jgi:hypothetical protein
LACTLGALAVLAAPAGASQRFCSAAAMPDPHAEIVSYGPTCRTAKLVLDAFFVKVQEHGPPLTVRGFRCSAEAETIECRRRLSIITYDGGLSLEALGVPRAVAGRGLRP